MDSTINKDIFLRPESAIGVESTIKPPRSIVVSESLFSNNDVGLVAELETDSYLLNTRLLNVHQQMIEDDFIPLQSETHQVGGVLSPSLNDLTDDIEEVDLDTPEIPDPIANLPYISDLTSDAFPIQLTETESSVALPTVFSEFTEVSSFHESELELLKGPCQDSSSERAMKDSSSVTNTSEVIEDSSPKYFLVSSE